jgi:hypothetical protein
VTAHRAVHFYIPHILFNIHIRRSFQLVAAGPYDVVKVSGPDCARQLIDDPAGIIVWA